jgi:hypothetical protein
MVDSNLSATLAVASPDQFLQLEWEHGLAHDGLAKIDHIATNLIAAALSGRSLVNIARTKRGNKNSDVLTLSIPATERPFIDQTFGLSKQQARGAWFLPEEVSLKASTVNLPAYVRHLPWHAMTLAGEDVARTRLGSTSDALLTWALLIPLFNTLLAPITERAVGSTKSAEDQKERWAEILDTYHHLGIRAASEIERFAYRGGWSELDRTGQVQARTELLDTLACHDLGQIASRFRALQLQRLVAATVKKSSRGTPLARQVLTKALQPILAAYFAGDWLEYLNYLELRPNTNEEIITALPTPKLYVGGSSKAATIAAEQDIDLDDVNAMLAAFMGQNTSVSPVEQRVDALTRWWSEFGVIHARQTSAMRPLWGLVQDGPYHLSREPRVPDHQLYQSLLSSQLIVDVDRLWDGVTLMRWPNAIVSEPYPHKLMAETLGTAVTTWHGIALTAWYVCEGPYSRTTLSGLPDYHAKHLAELAAAGTPIDIGLFTELQHAENRLGPPEYLETHTQEVEAAAGATISIEFSSGGQRRDGFEILRDIITRHRTMWTEQYLQDYLRQRWNHELTHVARELHKFHAAKGKAPTFRQFARFAATAANHWFNGDLASLYTAIGEKAPATPRRVDMLPIGAHEFVRSVYMELAGKPYTEELRIDSAVTTRSLEQVTRLAEASVYYIQVAEALGRPPEPKEFGINRYEWDWAGSPTLGWPRYQQAIEKTRSTLQQATNV